MPLTPAQGVPLAAFIVALRPDWQRPGVLHYLGKLKDDPTPAGTIALAAIRAALDPGARTPAVIPHKDGLHWQTDRPTDPPRPRLTPEHECPHHIGQWAATCSPCAGERLGRPDDERHGEDPDDYSMCRCGRPATDCPHLAPDDLGGHPADPAARARILIANARTAAAAARATWETRQAELDKLEKDTPKP